MGYRQVAELNIRYVLAEYNHMKVEDVFSFEDIKKALYQSFFDDFSVRNV